MAITNKIKIAIVIFLILTIIFVVFSIWPLLREIKESSENILSQKAALVTLEAKTKNLEEFKSNYQEIKPNLEKIDALFIDPEVPVDFIRFLEKTSRESQADLKISPAFPTQITKEPWPSLLFQLTTTSSFPNFLKFLEKLESSIYLIEIQSLNISRLTETELKAPEFEKFSLGDVRARVSLKVFTK